MVTFLSLAACLDVCVWVQGCQDVSAMRETEGAPPQERGDLGPRAVSVPQLWEDWASGGVCGGPLTASPPHVQAAMHSCSRALH